MIQNVGRTDFLLRIVLGAVLIAGSVSGLIGAWGWLGVVPLTTAVFRFCPAYLPFGVNTCRKAP